MFLSSLNTTSRLTFQMPHLQREPGRFQTSQLLIKLTIAYILLRSRADFLAYARISYFGQANAFYLRLLPGS